MEKLIRRKAIGYTRGDSWKEFDTKEKKEALGFKDNTVQGFQDMLDVDKLVKRYNPQQLMQLSEKAKLAKYGVNPNKSLREHMIDVQSMQLDFMQLPAIIREHFKNDKFAFHDYLNKNKNKENKYILHELHAEITGSDLYKLQIEKLKRLDEENKNNLLKEEEAITTRIKKALTPDPK